MTYFIVNDNTKECVVTKTESFNGDWRIKYDHIKNEDYGSITAYSIDDTVNGIPYVYDLCPDGMLVTFLVDSSMYSDSKIKRAEMELRADHDVVSLKILKIKIIAK